MNDYRIGIFYSEEDEGYIANMPDLVFCSAFAATPEDALIEIKRASEAWLDVAAAKASFPCQRFGVVRRTR